MIVKPYAPPSAIAVLEASMRSGRRSDPELQANLVRRRKGADSERRVAEILDLAYGPSPHHLVFHGLRLRGTGGIVEIDHLVVDRWLRLHAFETKTFGYGARISARGEFLARRADGSWLPIPSPVEQARRGAERARDVASAHGALGAVFGFRRSASTFIHVPVAGAIERDVAASWPEVVRLADVVSRVGEALAEETFLERLVRRMNRTGRFAAVADRLMASHAPYTVFWGDGRGYFAERT